MGLSKPELPSKEPVYDPNRPLPTTQLLFNHLITNIPDKSIVAFLVELPPGGSTPPHNHAGAFVSAHILSGHIFNAMNSDPIKVFGPGENFSENPECRHRVCDNTSATEPATFVATLIIDTKTVEELGVDGLTVIDKEYKEMIAKARNSNWVEVMSTVSKTRFPLPPTVKWDI